MNIGVLALQGAFAEHIAALHELDVEAMPVRLPRQLAGIDGLIIPGGESTSIGKLIRDYNLTDEIKVRAQNGLPIMGTCAGMILLAQELGDEDATPLGLMDIKVQRNAFGRQRESFEAELAIPAIGNKPFPGIFIRAPLIKQANGTVEVLARLNGNIVAARQGKLITCAFHPELSGDLRFHKFFLDIASGKK